ncbi:D-hydroxyisocaproate dehydrogenase [Lactobacillus equicursoris DSM 19284 = JCM 14600 = CIP 110162]|nr:D-2-hydroxyacid dehydrogenase [Lactobacillus equicursoris]MDD6387263.1 D-2-hydroxyacid dehydrogenase [Lactobacillus equicursoris]MDD6407960.1 D-2-hydroxyacid dehydrogenase [Lactobacillus equicursoris]MST80356.1 D-2-hydroxyacid dehydrogenase [Lactobacillus equicursoris]CCK86033.1 D-hydroxyisocaproate dehydrogenase [Lactobacillus equicursoris DSM 19284 = JCM 14600 = CIP 110162]
MKIAMYNVAPIEVDHINEWVAKNHVEVVTTDKPLTAETVSLAEGCTSVSLKPLGPIAEEEVYKKLHEYGVKCIGLRIVGFNTINFDYTKKYDLLVTNVPVYSPRAIAEMTVTQAMYLLRKIGIFKYRMDHDHDFTWPADMISNEIYNLTVGLIGVGHIGSAVAQIFSAMGAKVIAYDVAYNPEFEPFLTYTDFDTVLKEADIISLHTPLFPSTEKMIGEAQFKEMKNSAYLINCARGELVDTEALIKALQSGEIAGAGLDTLAGESSYFSHKGISDDEIPEDFKTLSKMPNVVITPHAAFYTTTSIRNMVQMCLDDQVKIANGQRVRTIVNG